MPPLIDAKNLHDIVMVAGDRVKFDLPFQGIPVPEVIWMKNGDEENPLETTSDKNLMITTTEHTTKLIINNVTKKDKGVYQCIVRNEVGEDSAKGEIKVLDRPEPPEGLTASVDGDKCVLMWKRSKDDGGAPIEHYQVCTYPQGGLRYSTSGYPTCVRGLPKYERHLHSGIFPSFLYLAAE